MPLILYPKNYKLIQSLSGAFLRICCFATVLQHTMIYNRHIRKTQTTRKDVKTMVTLTISLIALLTLTGICTTADLLRKDNEQTEIYDF